MTKTYDKKENLTGYLIGNDISIHSNINDPESWFLTIRKLSIFAERLCKKDLSEKEIANAAWVRVDRDYLIAQELKRKIIQIG